MFNFATISSEAILLLGKKLIELVAIYVIGSFAIKAVLKALEKILQKSKVDTLVHKFALSAAKVALYVVLCLSLLTAVGININSILTALAAAGMAVALALQGSLSNLAGGILVMITKPFKLGDYITCAGSEGSVASIDLLHTTIKTADGKVIVVPNSQLTSNSITNFSGTGNRRVDMEVGIAYESDIETAKKALIALAAADGRVYKDPAPFCEVATYADSAVVLCYRVWCSNADFWGVKFDLQSATKQALIDAGVAIPFPQVDVHVKQN